MSYWRRNIKARFKPWKCNGSWVKHLRPLLCWTQEVFCLSSSGVLTGIPPWVLCVWVFPELVLVALSPHTSNEGEEGDQHLGSPLIANPLDLAAARNLLLTPPLLFFSQHCYKREVLLPNQPLTAAMVPKWSNLRILVHDRLSQGQNSNWCSAAAKLGRL